MSDDATLSREPPSDFASLGLSTHLVRALRELGIEVPTPVQAAVVPEVLAGRDVWASAETGSGKTAAFVLPMLERLSRTRPAMRRCRALVLCPTRELAIQTGDFILEAGRHLPWRFELRVVFGGVSINPQMMSLRGGADIVVATPGRLLDLLDKNALSLGAVELLVLDEADRLLDRGFALERDRVLAALPRSRQTLLLSATFPPAVHALADAVLREPRRIAISSTAAPPPTIEQRAIEVDAPRRTQLLRRLLDDYAPGNALVFVATTYATDHVAEKLRRLGFDAASLHGKLAQGTRAKTLAAFREARLRVLVATDLAARGLDIEHLALVVSYDLPRSPADHLHRIGRTGRAGRAGVAISFVTPESAAHFTLIERRQRVSVPRERIEGFEPTGAPPEAPGTGGVKGKRKSKKDKLREAAARAAPPPPRDR